uniref:Large ribosomal subunit protein eL22 n=1 Tax=Petromyzon marinus TaxID=7757 RepID=A0AAJ7X4Y7_PETMA|nr:LOW QUALITY PROTEIN: 60S ribosomal protein L22-like [Petromyzon marinus]
MEGSAPPPLPRGAGNEPKSARGQRRRAGRPRRASPARRTSPRRRRRRSPPSPATAAATAPPRRAPLPSSSSSDDGVDDDVDDDDDDDDDGGGQSEEMAESVRRASSSRSSPWPRAAIARAASSRSAAVSKRATVKAWFFSPYLQHTSQGSTHSVSSRGRHRSTRRRPLVPAGRHQHRNGKKKKKLVLKCTLDCTHPVEDGIMDSANFERFLKERIKVDGKTGKVSEHSHVMVERSKSKITVSSEISFSKRYLKYLKRIDLRDWLRVVAASKESYGLRYFQINQDEEEDEED